MVIMEILTTHRIIHKNDIIEQIDNSQKKV